MLKTALHTAMQERYGANTPAEVSARVREELTIIKSNGWEADFLRARQITGQLRQAGIPWIIPGMDGGNSLIAFLLGIAQVNPLPPHYYCPKCKQIKFVTGAKDGFDLPETTCNICGTKRQGDGHQIDISWFANGDFSPFREYRIPACGLSVIGTALPTTALELLNRLSEKTGIDAETILPNDPSALHSLFAALGEEPLTEKNLAYTTTLYDLQSDETPFDHKLRTQMAKETPCFSELIRFQGMYHMTIEGAEELPDPILKTFCDRDSVLEFLVRHGAPKKDAFLLAQKIRKGDGHTGAVKAQLKELAINPKTIATIEHIVYLFPRAHAVSFGMLYARLAWFSLHYPEEYLEALKQL